MVQTFTPKLDGVVSCDLLLLGDGGSGDHQHIFPPSLPVEKLRCMYMLRSHLGIPPISFPPQRPQLYRTVKLPFRPVSSFLEVGRLGRKKRKAREGRWVPRAINFFLLLLLEYPAGASAEEKGAYQDHFVRGLAFEFRSNLVTTCFLIAPFVLT